MQQTNQDIVACAGFDSHIPSVSVHAAAKIGSISVLKVSGHADQAVKVAVKDLLSRNPILTAFVKKRHGIFGLAGSIIHAE